MMPMPIPKIRAKRFNRMSKEDYITWLSGYIGVEADSTVYSKTTRMQIDERFEYLMSQSEMEQPPWVDAVCPSATVLPKNESAPSLFNQVITFLEASTSLFPLFPLSGAKKSSIASKKAS